MPKKKLFNRLNNLFADLEQDATFLPTSGDKSLPGWTWECDEQGLYIACGSEVETILGILPQNFIGQPLDHYAMQPESADSLRACIAKDEFPLIVDLDFQASDGELIHTKMHIFASPREQFVEETPTAGFRGFVQVIKPVAAYRTAPSVVPPQDLPSGNNYPEPGTSVFPKEDWFVSPTAPTLPVSQEVRQADKLFVRPSGASGPATITVPVKAKEDSLGLLEFVDDTPGRLWSTDEQQLVQQIADQLSLALENAHSFEAEQRRASELDTLVELSRLISQNMDLEEIYTTAHRIISQLMLTDAFAINLLDKQTNEFIHAYTVDRGQRLPVNRFPSDMGFSGHVLRTGQPYIAHNLDEEITPFERAKPIGTDEYSRSAVVVPLRFSGEIIGVLSTQSYQPNAYGDNEFRLISTFADHIAIAIQNARLYQQEQRRRQMADALRDIASVVSSTLELRDVIERMLDKLPNLIEFSSASIQLIQKGLRQLIGGRGFDIESIRQVGQNPWVSVSEDPFIEEIVNSKLPLLISDTYSDSRWQLRAENSHVRSWMISPLIAGQEVVGVISLSSTVPEAYTTESLELLNAVAAQAAVAIQNARLFQQSQDTLSETETLYLASAELNTAHSQNDILDTLRRQTIVGQGSHYISLVYFDHPWIKDKLPDQLTILSRWTETPSDLPTTYSFSSFPALAKLLKPDLPVLVENLERDARIDDNTRTFYTQRIGAKSACFFSIVVSGEWLGFIDASYPDEKHFPESDVRRTSALVNQAAVAIQNLRNIEIAEQHAQEAHQRSDELALINRVVSAVVSSPDLRQVLDTMAMEFINVFALDQVGIALLDEDKKQLTIVSEKFRTPTPSVVGTTIPLAENPASARVVSSRKSLVIPDAQTNPLLSMRHVGARWNDVHSVILLPIITGGEVIGTVRLDIMENDRIFSSTELTLAETLVGQISTAVQNANLFEQVQKALSETETLYLASADLNAVKSYDDILSTLRKSTLLGNPDTSQASICLFDRPWVGDEMPESFFPIARWTRPPYLEMPSQNVYLRAWTTANQLFRPDLPSIVLDSSVDERIDNTARALYVDQLGAKSLILVPLNVGGDWIGFINATFTQSVPFPEQQVRRLTALSSQAAITIQSIRLLDETIRRAAQLETAAEIARDTSGTLALEVLLKRAVNLVRDRYGYYHASIFLVDDLGLNAVIRESTGEAGDELKRRGHNLPVGSRSIIGYVTELGKSLVINDVTQDPIHRPNPLLPDTRAELGIPLKIGNRVIGAMDVQSTTVNAFTPDDIAVLQTLADQIAVALDNARSYELTQEAVKETRQRIQELGVLFNVSQSLAGASMATEEIANIIARRFIEQMNLPQCSISSIDRGTDELVTVMDLTKPRDNPKSNELTLTGEVGTRFRLIDYPGTGKVVESLFPLVVQIDDPNADPAEVKYMREHGDFTLVIVPMAVKGQAIGIIELEAWDYARVFTPEQLNLMTILANVAAVAFENANLYEEQTRTAEKLREVDRMKSQFLANMSHELRTPLNSIIGFSRVILKGIDGPVTELQHQDLSAIYSSGQHLLNLINDILDISKIEAGKMELAFDEHVNIADMITSVMSTAVGFTKDKQVKLIKNIPPDIPTVRADPTRLRQVILNLLNNAAKFTDQGSITVEASIQTGPKNYPEMMIKVIDTGVGITPEDQKKLFQPFSQVDDSPTRKTGGTGLGLSISRMLIDMHGGRIGVDSEAGKGSTFYITLPLPLLKQKIASEKKIVLAIDDERQILSLYQRYLSEHGYQIVPLTDPNQALERARQVQPYAITLDVMMPGKNGWQVLEELKNDPETRHIPVIICSILEDQEKGFSLGASDYLAKPFLEEELLNALERQDKDGSITQILVIDDDENDLRLVEKILKKDPQYMVELAKSGAEGMVALRNRPPHALILDLFMPGLDGFSILETMRADQLLRDIPVIIFTAGDLTEEQKNTLSKFSSDMLHKGLFEEKELLSSIERALERIKPPTDEQAYPPTEEQ